MNKHLKIGLAVLLVLTVAACAHQPAPIRGADVPGFWMGLFHGFFALFALIAHLFEHDVRIYAYPNSGWWYDLGFFLGVAILGGGSGGIMQRKKPVKEPAGE